MNNEKTAANRSRVAHPIAPVFDERSEILILGSFPSVKSREQGFFYGHPQNRFWKVLAAVFEDELPGTIAEKRAFLLRNRVALWDVIAECEIVGSSDSSVRGAVPTDLSAILSTAPVRRIFTNGKTAGALYARFQRKQTGMEALTLPSTSPANASWSLDRLIEAWKIIRK